MKTCKEFNRIFFLCLNLVVFIACSGVNGSGDAPVSAAAANPAYMFDAVTDAGIKVQSNGYSFYSDDIDRRFNETMQCTGFNNISSDIFIILKEPYSSFPCIPIPTGCGGVFDIDNGEPVITVTADFVRLRHEFIHYILYIHQGDADSNHNSKLFEFCS